MPKTEPLVSIVIPAYNHAGYLPEAIDSVLVQRYPRVELIVLDDGSTDSTRQVLERYGSRFRWESHANVGQSATLARGWAMARGQVLAYLSADDRLEREAVAEAIAVLETQDDVVATYCDFTLIDPQSRVVRRVRAPDYDYGDMLGNVNCLPGPGAFFRRSAYEQAGVWDPSLRQMPDYDFWLRLGLCGRFVRIPKVLASFRVHPASMTYGVVSPERAREAVIIVSRLLGRRDLPAPVAALGDTALANAWLSCAQLDLRAGRLRAASAAVRHAVRFDARVLLRPRTVRMLANALVNRAGHRLLWSLRALVARAPQ